MTEPLYPVFYWRDFETRTELTEFDTLKKLIDAKPLQVVELEKDDNDNTSVTNIINGGTGNIVDEPLFNPDGTKTIEKQQVGAIAEHSIITLKIHKSQYAKLRKIQTFYRKPNKEKEYHTYGILGFWFPATETDPTPTLTTPNVFKVDPTNIIGYTMKPPIVEWGIPAIGAEYTQVTLELSLGGKNLT